MHHPLFPAASTLALLLLAACNGTDPDDRQDAAAPPASAEQADPLLSRDPAPGEQAEAGLADAQPRPVMQAQVVLERLGFAPGVIDGEQGMALTNALRAFQEARELAVTGELDEATRQALSRWNNIPATRVITIPAEWAELVFTPVPEGAEQQAQMTALGYESMAEKLAERFHTTPEVLAMLNPDGRPATAGSVQSPTPTPTASAAPTPPVLRLAAGQQVRVPNVGGDRIVAGEVDNPEWLATLRSLGVGSEQPEAARIVVDKSGHWLQAFGEDGRMLAAFTVSTGSSYDPLPIGTWGIKGKAYNPPFAYDPDLFWDVPDSAEDQQLPPGPNGPVGVVWIDLTKEHYGIHGTPAPETIGRAQSHGCVRLTNWDAARLAQMVTGSTEVVFQE